MSLYIYTTYGYWIRKNSHLNSLRAILSPWHTQYVSAQRADHALLLWLYEFCALWYEEKKCPHIIPHNRSLCKSGFDILDYPCFHGDLNLHPWD